MFVDLQITERKYNNLPLERDAATPTPLNLPDVDALGMFFETSINGTWHSEPELRQMFYGEVESIDSNV